MFPSAVRSVTTFSLVNLQRKQTISYGDERLDERKTRVSDTDLPDATSGPGPTAVNPSTGPDWRWRQRRLRPTKRSTLQPKVTLQVEMNSLHESTLVSDVTIEWPRRRQLVATCWRTIWQISLPTHRAASIDTDQWRPRPGTNLLVDPFKCWCRLGCHFGQFPDTWAANFIRQSVAADGRRQQSLLSFKCCHLAPEGRIVNTSPSSQES